MVPESAASMSLGNMLEMHTLSPVFRPSQSAVCHLASLPGDSNAGPSLRNIIYCLQETRTRDHFLRMGILWVLMLEDLDSNPN